MRAHPLPPQPINAPKAHIKQPVRSRWGEINKNLLAQIYTVDKHGVRTGKTTVECAITEGNFDLANQYSSPFADKFNLDQKYPTLMGAIQSGVGLESLGTIAQLTADVTNTAIQKVAGSDNKLLASLGQSINSLENQLSQAFEGSLIDSIIQKTGQKIVSLEGKSNLTKVNSTMVYVSTEPIRLQLTLFFRAWENAKLEVEKPLKQLQQWALPVKLGESLLTDGLFPSIAPPFIAISHAGNTYLPLLIESMSTPLVTERDRHMNRLAASVTLSLVSRTAWDANNIRYL